MSTRTVIILLILFSLISFGLHIYKRNTVPPCINADEAAFGYNAYSILKTGKDEYGHTMPLRLKSFGDYKLPLYSYLSIPFIAVFGLQEWSVKTLNYLIGIAFVPLIHVLALRLTQKRAVALIASFLASISVWIHLISRHAHEAALGALCILISVYFLAGYMKRKGFLDFIFTTIFVIFSTFSYHTGRIFLVTITLVQLYVVYTSQIYTKKKVFLYFAMILALFIAFAPDIRYGATRVNNLFFTHNEGFGLRISEYQAEHKKMLHNGFTEGVYEIVRRYTEQLSSNFFVDIGDSNPRFGFEYLGLITFAEYFFFFIGLYYLFTKKQPLRGLILILFFVSPIGNTLTWQDPSLTRTYFMIVPFLIIVSYGMYYTYRALKLSSQKWLFYCLIASLALNLAHNWDVYFYHYPKRGLVTRAWQCGYKELVSYIEQNYDAFDEFRITTRHGQPYIFLLFYLKYPPSQYQKHATLSSPDVYGFGQVEEFDKFIFNFSIDLHKKGISYIGYPEHFTDNKNIDLSRIKKITIGNEEMFWIYET